MYISFAVPKGIPEKPGEKNFAIRTGNHPLKYAGFEDAIPEGETGTGEVPIGIRIFTPCVNGRTIRSR